ncbi:uncharacterized protein LOC111699810 [Eurytemora carolleeae]|uniref:uncharacterized protein LOC111699810 n=1 Tax=Eurytemora carolleeae TaxID=1294199 RepID=UPI000C75D625|nr:uncharacterized protein LOC111699810 [Eurytemora carolleeae]|eukprot:XP_023326313.1 uncharacterized protein LOC111699810 [Eurytemora affinis]
MIKLYCRSLVINLSKNVLIAICLTIGFITFSTLLLAPVGKIIVITENMPISVPHFCKRKHINKQTFTSCNTQDGQEENDSISGWIGNTLEEYPDSVLIDIGAGEASILAAAAGHKVELQV